MKSAALIYNPNSGKGKSTARAEDLRSSGDIGSTAANVRRLFSRFLKCYFIRKGYREGGYGLLISICAGLYPLLSHLKAKHEQEQEQEQEPS